MSDYDSRINHHYGQDDLPTKILATLQAAGKNIHALTRDDLMTFDEFHIGGIAETRNLANMIPGGLSQKHVLDLGSGLGGPARTLAAEFGCRVNGVDLTEAFCQAANMLTERVGLGDQVAFRQGNVLDMPFEDTTFDVAWTQFVGMNIGEKARLYAEVHRVIRDGGYFAFHEIMAGNTTELHFPVLWANEPSISFLRTPDEIRQLLSDTGFKEIVWKDLSQHSTGWFKAMLSAPVQANRPRLGFNVFIADNVPQKAANIVRNLEEGRIVVVQGVFEVNK